MTFLHIHKKVYHDIFMTECEVGAVKDLITHLETATLKSEEKKAITRITQFVNSIHAMRTGSTLSGWTLHKIERSYMISGRDITYKFTFSIDGDKYEQTRG